MVRYVLNFWPSSRFDSRSNSWPKMALIGAQVSLQFTDEYMALIWGQVCLSFTDEFTAKNGKYWRQSIFNSRTNSRSNAALIGGQVCLQFTTNLQPKWFSLDVKSFVSSENEILSWIFHFQLSSKNVNIELSSISRNGYFETNLAFSLHFWMLLSKTHWKR